MIGLAVPVPLAVCTLDGSDMVVQEHSVAGKQYQRWRIEPNTEQTLLVLRRHA